MSTDLAVRAGGEVVTRDYLDERRELIRSQLAPKVSDAELSMFLEVCAARGLNPLTGQIHAVSRWDSRERRDKLTIQTGIDGFRLIAQRTGEYRGQVGPEWCGPDGVWRDVWLDDAPPAAARVGVLRAGWSEPLFGVARWRSYVQTTKDGNPTRMWAQMPDVMLAKVAEALALRKAFPEEMSGLYTADEMAQADRPQTAAVVPDVDAVVSSRRMEVMCVGAGDGEPEVERKRRQRLIADALQAEGYTRDDLADDQRYSEALLVAERAVAERADAKAATADEAVMTFRDQPPEVLTTAQMRAVHAAGRQHGLDHDALRAIAADLFQVESMTEVPRDGMDRMLEAIEAHGGES